MRDHLEINRILLSKRFQEFDTHGSIYLWKKNWEMNVLGSSFIV